MLHSFQSGIFAPRYSDTGSAEESVWFDHRTFSFEEVDLIKGTLVLPFGVVFQGVVSSMGTLVLYSFLHRVSCGLNTLMQMEKSHHTAWFAV